MMSSSIRFVSAATVPNGQRVRGDEVLTNGRDGLDEEEESSLLALLVCDPEPSPSGDDTWCSDVVSL